MCVWLPCGPRKMPSRAACVVFPPLHYTFFQWHTNSARSLCQCQWQCNSSKQSKGGYSMQMTTSMLLQFLVKHLNPVNGWRLILCTCNWNLIEILSATVSYRDMSLFLKIETIQKFCRRQSIFQQSLLLSKSIQLCLLKRVRPGCVRIPLVWDWSSIFGKDGLWRHQC